MPKVVREYKEQAKKRIMEAAYAEFARKGYRETTMSDIAEKVGVSKAAVYQYFESKEALIGALGEFLTEGMILSEFSPLRKGTLIEITEGAFERVLSSMPSWFPNLICDFLSEAHRNKKARLQVREIDRKLVAAVSGFWEDRKKAGEVPSDVDTEGVARGLVALQLGLLAFVSAGFPRSKAIEVWTEMVKRLVHGLGRQR